MPNTIVTVRSFYNRLRDNRCCVTEKPSLGIRCSLLRRPCGNDLAARGLHVLLSKALCIRKGLPQENAQNPQP